MKVEFINNNQFSPSEIAVSAARTCYASKGIVTPEKSVNWQRKKDLLNDLFDSGHHTTLQHYHITMMIDGVSRFIIYEYLHNHKYYNSEQVSQRYAEMKIENCYIPSNVDQKKWKQFYEDRFKTYHLLINELTPELEKLMPKHRKKDGVKKAMEIARYVLPQGVTAYLYHTVNIITLLRYITVLSQSEYTEAKELGELFEKELLKLDITFEDIINKCKKMKVNKEKENFNFYDIDEKYITILNTNIENNEIGLPNNNHYSDVLRLSSYFTDQNDFATFETLIKLSLSADAQNQRHRTSITRRQNLKYSLDANYQPIDQPYLPKQLNEKLKEIYLKDLNESYTFMKNENTSFENKIYTLPNAHMNRIIELNNLKDFVHKAQMRLCYNAQEEIYDITYEQTKYLKEKYKIDFLLPPCGIRNKYNLKPICPEGIRYCGTKVWKLNLEDYQRKI